GCVPISRRADVRGGRGRGGRHGRGGLRRRRRGSGRSAGRGGWRRSTGGEAAGDKQRRDANDARDAREQAIGHGHPQAKGNRRRAGGETVTRKRRTGKAPPPRADTVPTPTRAAPGSSRASWFGRCTRP